MGAILVERIGPVQTVASALGIVILPTGSAPAAGGAPTFGSPSLERGARSRTGGGGLAPNAPTPLDVSSKARPKLAEDLVPNLLSFGEVLKVKRDLPQENVSIWSRWTLLEATPSTRDPDQLTEFVRQQMSRQLTASYRGPEGTLSALILDPSVEAMFRRSLSEIAGGPGGQVVTELEAGVSRMQTIGLAPCTITSLELRRYIRAFAERRCPELGELSFREADPSVGIKPLESISFGAQSA